MLSSLFGIGTEFGNTGDDAIADAIRDSAGQTIGRAGDRIVERQLQIPPTITIGPGARVSVLVSRDIVFPAWARRAECSSAYMVPVALPAQTVEGAVSGRAEGSGSVGYRWLESVRIGGGALRLQP